LQLVNDDVMGGVSAGNFGATNGGAVFRGELSLENNGGFAFVRSLPSRHDSRRLQRVPHPRARRRPSLQVHRAHRPLHLSGFISDEAKPVGRVAPAHE